MALTLSLANGETAREENGFHGALSRGNTGRSDREKEEEAADDEPPPLSVIGSPGDYCKQVFVLCDPDGKGYITREEISKLCDRRNSVLDSIMSTLDSDQDGRISYEEFEEGFENYSHSFLVAHGASLTGEEDEALLMATTHVIPAPVMSTPIRLPRETEEYVYESEGVRCEGVGSEMEEEEKWQNVAEKIDPDNLLVGTEVGKVWSELAMRDPSLLEHFEQFLSGVTEELKQSHNDREKLQTHMKRVIDQHNREVTEMEDLLEQHLSEVNENHQLKSANKTHQLSTRFQSLLAARDQVIHQLVDKEDHLKMELQSKSQNEEKLREEKEKLLKANRLLKEQLELSLKTMSLNHSLKSMSLNRRSASRHSATLVRGGSLDASSYTGQPVCKAEEELVKYRERLFVKGVSHEPRLIPVLSQEILDFDLSSDASSTQMRRKVKGGGGGGEEGRGGGEEGGGSIDSKEAMKEGFESRPSSLVVSKEHSDAVQASLHMELTQQAGTSSGNAEKSLDNHVTSRRSTVSSSAISHLTNDILTYSTQASTATLEKSSSVSRATWNDTEESSLRPSSPMTVNRVFKVVFLGNSGVGKTSLIVRLSHGQFSPVNSTLGLDFTTKTLIVGEERVVFQLWDTAGQERFHNALTSVYFRRADAFVIVYDVTCRESFKSVRSWLSIIMASLREHPPVLMLVGNKCDEGHNRNVTSEEGRQLALELHAMFSEMSALSGTNVVHAHQTLARLLLSRENEELELARRAALSLRSNARDKKRCFC